MSLRLAPDLELPLDAITQTFGILAMRGAGKSNAAAVMAEEMHRARLPFVAVDPVGSWWGLRSSADGRRAGLDVPIFGGRHGDVPLERTGGQVLADLVVDDRVSCVLDISEFSEGDKVRFLIDFAERLYRRNTDPLHLFLEEADDYAPQRPFREQARLRACSRRSRRCSCCARPPRRTARRGVALEHFPAGVSREQLSEHSGYSITSSSFANALGRLRTLQLITGRDEISASRELFA